MQYHQYLEKGLLIGSRAIESTHKDVLQQRLKLSGQRWTIDSFQQMAQLRVIYKSKDIELNNYVKIQLNVKFVVHPLIPFIIVVYLP